MNLFSLNKALDNGHKMVADSDICKFYDEEKVVAVANDDATT